MAYKINKKPAAEKDFRSFSDVNLQKAIASNLDNLKSNPLPERVKQLNARAKIFRVKVRKDYRIIYKVDHDSHTVIILRIMHRNEGYPQF
jgi:mRNA-degrading endonuclease RelE of RelBE toxin-antitoxin system